MRDPAQVEREIGGVLTAPFPEVLYPLEALTGLRELQDRDEIDLVQVTSGDILLIRDEVNENLDITDARERLVNNLNNHFVLTGVVVAGRRPLELFVVPADKARLLRYLNSNPPSKLVGRVIVDTKA